MANYDVIEGIRKDSSIFVHGSYSYRKDKDYKGIRYLRCTKFRDGCSARARICLHSNVFSIIQDHGNHETADTQVKITKVISKLKRKAEDSQQSLREIFDEEANQSEVGTPKVQIGIRPKNLHMWNKAENSNWNKAENSDWNKAENLDWNMAESSS